MKRSHGFSFLASLALVAAAACGDSNPAPAPDAGSGPTPDPNTVSTTSGTVHGSATASVRSFKGVPYAQPPVGSLRWGAPQAAVTSTTTIDATAFGKHCPQPASPFGSGTNTDESCLFLNVFAPATATATSALPVMVWFHGGALLVGETDEYDPTPLLAQGVIVVTVNYRLGLLGFMSHASLSAEQGGFSGNYGFMDQQLALTWVKQNIAAFGGDKTNVTIFGESAGGLSVHSHLVSAGSAGLFSKAIIESGAYANTIAQLTLADASAQGQTFAATAGCTSTPCSLSDLRNLKVADLLTAGASVSSWIPAVDGKVLTQPIGAALAAGSFAKVPVIEGSNHDEYRLFVGLDEAQAIPTTGPNKGVDTPLAAANFQTAVETAFGTNAGGLTALYPPAQFSSDPNIAASLAFGALGTDVVFACNSRLSSKTMSGSAPKTFVYEFADEGAPELYLPPLKGVPVYGAAHASEIQYIFTLPLPSPALALSTDQQTLSKTMQTYWGNFAKSGDPNGTGLPTWPAYTATNDTVLSLAPGSGNVKSITNFATAHNCAIIGIN